MNDIERINKSIEKSNLILKKYKLLLKNNHPISSDKNNQVTCELITHLKETYSFTSEMFIELISQYRTDKEIIESLGGKEIANYIANSIENYLKQE